MARSARIRPIAAEDTTRSCDAAVDDVDGTLFDFLPVNPEYESVLSVVVLIASPVSPPAALLALGEPWVVSAMVSANEPKEGIGARVTIRCPPRAMKLRDASLTPMSFARNVSFDSCSL